MYKPFKISKLHCIATNHLDVDVLEQVKMLCDSGADWIQLRCKNMSIAEVEKIAFAARIITAEKGARLVINDYPEIAKMVNADGVHLGKTDMPVFRARTIVAKNQLIGGTANTLVDVVNLVNEGVDYIGLGPFAFTETKKELSPVLGLEGYKKIFAACANMQLPPIIAIGGIKPEHVSDILKTGVYGVATSAALFEKGNISENVEAFKKSLA